MFKLTAQHCASAVRTVDAVTVAVKWDIWLEIAQPQTLAQLQLLEVEVVSVEATMAFRTTARLLATSAEVQTTMPGTVKRKL